MRKYRNNLDWVKPVDGGYVILSHHHGRPTRRMQFEYELRVNRLLNRHRPPIATPRLTACDRHTLLLEFDAA